MQILGIFLCMVFLIDLLTDLSLLKEFSKKNSFEDFHNFIWTGLSRSSGSWAVQRKLKKGLKMHAKTLILIYKKFRYHKVYMVFLKDFLNKFSNFWMMCWFVRLFHDDTRSLVVNAALTLMLLTKKNKKKHVQKTLSPFKTLGLNERFFFQNSINWFKNNKV